MGTPFRTIVIADENDALRQGVRVFVDRQGQLRVVAEAADGPGALEAVRETRPDIAIIANMLPLMNGLEVTRAIKRELPRTEVLIYTMYNSEALVTALLSAGARGYILKTDPQCELMAAVDALACRRPYFSREISQVLLERILASGRPEGAGETLLTPRQSQIAQLVAEGKTNKEIAAALGNSVKTVETHRLMLMRQLNLRTTADLVRYALRNQMVAP